MAKRASWHESGHSIIGRVLGFDCGGAAITATGSGSAAVAPVFNLHWDLACGDILASVFDKLCCCWAGPMAETIVFGSADNRGDLRQIENLARRYFIQDRDIEAARARARELLMQPKTWDAVERVAASLLEKKILSGAEIDKICNCQ